MPQEAANDNKVSPFVWLVQIFSILCDIVKFFVFLLQLVPVVGTEISVVLSFYIAVVENIVVFGGFWLLGLYKSKKNQMFNMITSGSVASLNLVPVIDDAPFTSIAVFFMIVKAYAETKLGGLVTTVAVGAATGGAGLAAEGAVAAGEAGAAAEAAQAARTAQQAARLAADMQRVAQHMAPKQQPANDQVEEYDEAA